VTRLRKYVLTIGSAVLLVGLTVSRLTWAEAPRYIQPTPTIGGETVVVPTVDDVVDFPQPQTVAQLPGPDGKVSFREAITAANNTSGPQTIAFAIPQAEWWLDTTIALLRLEHGAFSITGDETTVDFSTQAAFTGDTNPDGNEVGIYGLEPNGLGSAAIFLNGNHCVIRAWMPSCNEAMAFRSREIITGLLALLSPDRSTPQSTLAADSAVLPQRGTLSAELLRARGTHFQPATAECASTGRRRTTWLLVILV